MKAHLEVNHETCERCGLCVAICPLRIPHLDSEQSDRAVVEFRDDRLQSCMRCGHCMAICPTESIRIDGLFYEEDFFDLPGSDWNADAFFALIASRRSVRIFKDIPVPQEALQRIVNAMLFAPMAYTPSKVEITVVQSTTIIEQALPIMVGIYEALIKRMKNPLLRYMIRRRLMPGTWTALREHVLPSLKYRLPDMKAGRDDTITWGTPTMFLFHAHRESGAHLEDVFIALTYGLLAAHALGLGATAIGLIPPVVDRSPELRAMLQIPVENEALASMIVGYPKYHFKRGIRREMARVKWI